MNTFSSLLNRLYDTDVTAFEKTAEDQLLAALREESQVEENPLALLSDEEIIKIAREQGIDLNEFGGDPEADDTAVQALIQETERQKIGGEVMAHAMIHELSLIKEAMLGGKCRLCKSSQRDVDGSSLCSNCMGQME